MGGYEMEDSYYEEDTLKDKYLIFYVAEEAFAIEIRYVMEIIGLQPMTSVPELPDYIRGIINLRGTIVPIMDVRLRFKKPFLEYTDRTCVIIVEMNEISMGLVVDRVAEVMTIPEDEIVDPRKSVKDITAMSRNL